MFVRFSRLQEWLVRDFWLRGIELQLSMNIISLMSYPGPDFIFIFVQILFELGYS